jgi:hypothetical protein
MTQDQLTEALRLIRTHEGRLQLFHSNTIYDMAQFAGQLRRSVAHRVLASELCQTGLALHPDHEPFMNVHVASLVDLGQTRNASRAAIGYTRAGRSPFFMRTLARLFSMSGLPGSAQHIFERSESGVPMTAEEARSLVLTLHRIVSNGGGAQHRPAAGAWYFENRVELEDDEPTVQAATKTAPATPQPLAGQPMKSKSLREVTVRALTSRQQIDRVGHHLSNCLSQYWSKVKSGQTWIYSVEINGKPTEAIEVHPVTRKVLQWKGVKNSAPNDKTKSVLAKELVSAGVLNANSLGG